MLEECVSNIDMLLVGRKAAKEAKVNKPALGPKSGDAMQTAASGQRQGRARKRTVTKTNNSERVKTKRKRTRECVVTSGSRLNDRVEEFEA